MTMKFIPNVNPGDSVGSKPTFLVNAQVRGDFLYLRDANGNKISGRSVSDGDEITVLKVDHGKQLALVQYPAGSIYRQGYVTNATNIIKYKNEYNWSNGSTPEIVYDVDKKTQIGSLNPREKATIIYKVDGMTALVYDTSKGKMTKSGLVHYEGTGGSTGGGDINGVAPGEIVDGGFTYDNNAQVIGDDLYLRDANGNQIAGRLVSNGDKITVLDVGYTKQLALVQYPASGVVRQGYVTNATKLIRYFRQGEWINGSTTEAVLDENGGPLGSISPYEAATPLYEKNGMTHVVYNTSKGANTKSGYVRYEGLGKLPDTNIQIPTVSHSQATVERYGTSERGRALNVYKIGNGSKVLFAGFAIHGWEDHWDNDGLALVKIANALIAKVGDYKAQNGLHGWTVYIAPCMNPDGVIVRGTKDGPGRCAVESRVDMNRCFPRGFSADYSARHYTGPEALGAPEAVALKNFIEKINKTADEMIVIDAHGWLGCTYGDSSIAQYFTNQFGFSHEGSAGGGFFSYWAQGLPRTRAILLEYPRSTYSEADVMNGNYIGKTFNGIINILKNNPNGSGDGGDNLNETPYNAEGKIVNVASISVLNVRSGPGTNYSIIGTLKVDDKVTIIARTKPTGESKEWYKIRFNNIYGYVHSDFVKIITLDEEDNSLEIQYDATGEIVNVSSTSVLNVRRGPGTNHSVIGTLKLGDKVTIVARIKPTGESKEWYKIRFNNIHGYVHSDFVKIITLDGGNDSLEIQYDATGEIVNVSSTSVLNVRRGPGTNHSVIGTLKLGDKVTIVARTKPKGESKEWYKIKFNNIYGYVHSDFVDVSKYADFDKKMIEYGFNIGIFNNLNIEGEYFNTKVNLGTISIYPLITVEAELSRTIKYGDAKFVNLTKTPGELTAEFLNNSNGIALDISKQKIERIFEKITLSRNILDNFRYQVILGPLGIIQVVIETNFEFKYNSLKEIGYQRLYITIHPDLNDKEKVKMPILEMQTESESNNVVEVNDSLFGLMNAGWLPFFSLSAYQFGESMKNIEINEELLDFGQKVIFKTIIGLGILLVFYIITGGVPVPISISE